jgi:hypothetical protein
MPPIYNLTEGVWYDDSKQANRPAILMDRAPQGILGEYAESNDSMDQHCMGPPVPRRHRIRLPEPVASKYGSGKSDYVDRYTLPGFISWLRENGYSTVDFRHVFGTEQGFWIEHTDSAGPEFKKKA